MATARVELYKDGDHMAVVTSANNEHDFWESFCELIGNLITDDLTTPLTIGEDGRELDESPNYGGDWEFQLRYWLPQATEIVCKLRGYKAEVLEQRVLVSGTTYPNPAHKVHEIGPSALATTADAAE